MIAGQDFTQMRQMFRRRDAARMMFFWLCAAAVFLGWGGYVMYTSMTSQTILAGMLLLLCAIVSAFLSVCSLIDLLE